MGNPRITIRLKAEELAELKKMAEAMNTTAASLARGYICSRLMGLDDPKQRDLQIRFDLLREDMERNLALTSAALAAAVVFRHDKRQPADEVHRKCVADLREVMADGKAIRKMWNEGKLG
jgi:hypothetical protein